ncbi:MAG: PIN domain-containing protein [Planctomycetota bacterium]
MVIDTNVLVSGLLSPYAASGEVVRMLVAGTIQPCLDARLICEYADVLNRPRFKFPPDAVGDLLEYFRHTGIFAAGSPLPSPLPDSDDEPFLEVALGAGAEYLITWNTKHFPPRIRKVEVLTPGLFLKKLRRQG